jgi:Flp pilus assembly protein TadD
LSGRKHRPFGAAALAAILACASADRALAFADNPAPMPDAAYVLYQEALDAMKAGDFKTALSDINAALALQDDSATLYVARGAIEDRSGDDAAAVADCTHAIALDPRSESAFAMRGQAERAMNVGDASPSVAAVRLKPSMDDLTQALALDPHDPVVLWLRGLDRLDSGDAAGSVADLSAAIAVQPKYAQAYLARGRAYVREGNVVLASADLRQAAALFKAQGDADNARIANAELAALPAPSP